MLRGKVMSYRTMMLSLAALWLTLALTIPMRAQSSGFQPFKSDSGWYGSISGSPVMTRDTAIDKNLGTAAQWKRGFAVFGAFGYRLPFNVRIEGEVGYQNNKNKAFVLSTATGASELSTGNVGLRSFMANGYYDLPLNPHFKPYFGAGIGVHQSCINGFTANTLLTGIPGVFPPTVLSICSFETRAWQIRTGVNFPVTKSVEFFTGFRFFGGNELKFNAVGFSQPVPNGAPTPGVDVTGVRTKHWELGVRGYF
jgi:opacity protein-like surface antigen